MRFEIYEEKRPFNFYLDSLVPLLFFWEHFPSPPRDQYDAA